MKIDFENLKIGELFSEVGAPQNEFSELLKNENKKAIKKGKKFKKKNFELTNRNPQQEVHNNQEENNNPLKINPNGIFQSSEKDQKQFFCNTTCFVTQFSRILIKSKFFETAESREVPPPRDSGGIPPVRFLWRRGGLGEWAQEAV